MNMQVLILVGRAVKDAEYLTSKAGKSYCKFSIAVNEYKSEKEESKTTYYDTLVFGKTSKKAGETVKKGDTIVVIGKPEANAYISKKDNEAKGAISVIAESWRVAK